MHWPNTDQQIYIYKKKHTSGNLCIWCVECLPGWWQLALLVWFSPTLCPYNQQLNCGCLCMGFIGIFMYYHHVCCIETEYTSAQSVYFFSLLVHKCSVDQIIIVHVLAYSFIYNMSALVIAYNFRSGTVCSAPH